MNMIERKGSAAVDDLIHSQKYPKISEIAHENSSTMFCLKGRNSGDAKLKEMLKQDDFGWWLNNEDNLKSPRTGRSKDRQSVGSTESMFSCVDSDDSDSYFLAQEFKQECNDNYEKIELTSLINEDLDINLIEQDAIENDTDYFAPFQTEDDGIRCSTDLKSQQSHGICYTPERLVRSQNYRILTPSPRYLSISQVRDMAENPWKTSLCRRGLNYLIDSNQDGAMQLKAFMNPNPKEIVVPTIDLHRRRKYERVYNISNGTVADKNETKKEDVSNGESNTESPNMFDCSFNKRSIYERLNDTWESRDKLRTRNSFSACSETSPFEDTSNIQSNDWTSNTHTLNMQSSSLSDELATTNYKIDATQGKCSTTNQAVSVFKALDTNPEEAAVLLEEDRFYDSMSTHDQLTRLALAIETDENMSTTLEKEPLIHLQNKIKKLQDSNKDIYRDISDLRKSFQCDEEKMADILFNTSKLRQEVHDLRYFDDLLNLLQGELERISKRNWPFVIGRTNNDSEEMNLIV
ncbi:hypothetical protein E2986_08982 [Frieseomelitta varia]|uniref:Uncharacterized protein n=1 Tax=Frieseomelitta varia TaxID=561572 RepID=A0A833VMG3_9HYME|nr:hypothetical protein E2986_08982 [Frieseomelitta varia]